MSNCLRSLVFGVALLLIFITFDALANNYPVLVLKQTQHITNAQLIHQMLNQQVFIKGGTYMMGTSNKKYFDITGDNAHPHKVSLSNFYFSKYLVSVTQFDSYLKSIGNDKEMKAQLKRVTFNNRPAQTNWHYAKSFCEFLAKKNRASIRFTN